MLRNCFLPVDYNQKASRVCGEIVYQNVDEFIITCTLCKIKIFEFKEFVTHLKNVHLGELVNEAAVASVSAKEEKIAKPLRDALDEDEDYHFFQIIKSEEDIDIDAGNTIDHNENKNFDVGDDIKEVAIDNYQFSEGDEEYIFSEDDAEDDEGDDEPEKSIIRKVIVN